MTVRVVITATIDPAHHEAFERAYLEVTAKVQGTPGHLRDELLRDAAVPDRYCLLAEWESEALFRAWADDPAHIAQSAAMYPYWADTFQRRIYDVRATLDSLGPAPAASPSA
ncbi:MULTISPECIES: antibiotic biosynthesis monooxygenase family protein [unclassified Streptomyces]|uniref:antibiotic biosynthesis monooxygenase family protein n=1 Tax=unclassified Streptomyces TaxID=2593676 RepID=UPI000697A815|nr:MULTISPECIES: antibiotic biosynthesis monooxygenase family protein [unclassified Streptomyces]